MIIYGLDPASKHDYFGIVVHKVEGGKARLLTLRKLRNVTFPDVQRLLKEELFVKYPPYHIVIDYSNEKTFSEMLIERYGDRRVETINFTQQNKLMLKQDGLKILQIGYEWPKSRNPQVQAWVEELKEQLRHEQMLETRAGKLTFDHPEGEHNDLAIAWELSVHGCLRFMERGKNVGITATKRHNIYGDDNIGGIGSGVPQHLRGLEQVSYEVRYPQ